jgi:hypothetical protein
MEGLEQDIWKQFLDTAANSYEDREVLYQHITALRNIKERLEQWVAQGKLADRQLKTRKK